MGEGPMSSGDDEALLDLLTTGRMSSYSSATGSPSAALRLYEWNMHASASVMELTGIVEIVARNALDRELAAWARRRLDTPEWFGRAPLDQRGTRDVSKAEDRSRRAGAPGEHGRVVAELSFGFWRYLVGSRYHASLWVPDLHRAFPYGPRDLRARRREVERRMRELHFVRNRAAHHEPIHHRDLGRDLTFALELLGWVHPVAAEWAARVTTLRAVVDARPVTVRGG